MILDWKEYEATAVKAVEEGIVLLENRNGALPLKENTPVAIYGRIQLHYYKSGTGSGGMVSIHAPVRERRDLRVARLHEEVVSIHAPVRERRTPCVCLH